MKHAHAAPILLLFAITGCGGGGETPTSATPDPKLAITSNNAMQAAKSAYELAQGNQQFAAIGTGNLLDALFDLSGSGVAQKMGNSPSQVPIPPQTSSCAVSGTATVSGDIADPVTPTITAGDFIELEYDACDEGFGGMTDGIVRTDFDAFSGDLLGGPVSMTVTATLTNFQISVYDIVDPTTITDTINMNGAATVDIDSTDALFYSTNISGSSLVVDTNGKSELLTNFASTFTVDLNFQPEQVTGTASGTLDSTELAGIIDYSTPVQFAGLGGEYPSSGEFLVEGSNSNLRLVAVDNVNIRIEIDLGADGTIDETIDTTWDELVQS